MCLRSRLAAPPQDAIEDKSVGDLSVRSAAPKLPVVEPAFTARFGQPAIRSISAAGVFVVTCQMHKRGVYQGQNQIATWKQTMTTLIKGLSISLLIMTSTHVAATA